MTLRDRFSKEIEAPDFIGPYLHFFATEEEMRVVVQIGRAGSPAPSGVGSALLDRAYRSYLLDREEKEGSSWYRAGSFYSVLKHFALFGNYHVIPQPVRQQLDSWDFAEYLRRNDNFRKIIDTRPDYDACHNEWVLLAGEVEEMIDAATAIRLLPCDCKMLADNCTYSREICLILDRRLISDRTGGRDLNRDEAKHLIRSLEKEGLMHTGGPPNWREAGPSVVCNCCGCCCYPFRASRLLGAKGKWPRSRYVAEHDDALCSSCGACVKRCHFDAFSFLSDAVGQGAERRVSLDPALCWGCGICASACPAHAIRMTEIPAAGGLCPPSPGRTQ
jgi:Pyruvate/2-oxoacid:ferredoxin oxidoreductase delta subunit